jgi:hypothetical protein
MAASSKGTLGSMHEKPGRPQFAPQFRPEMALQAANPDRYLSPEIYRLWA